MNCRVIYENNRKKKLKCFKLTQNLFEGTQVALYSLETSLFSTLNISYCLLLSLADHKKTEFKKQLNTYLPMMGVLNSVDIQMLRRGDNVPNTQPLPGKIIMCSMCETMCPIPGPSQEKSSCVPCVKLVIFSLPLALSYISLFFKIYQFCKLIDMIIHMIRRVRFIIF